MLRCVSGSILNNLKSVALAQSIVKSAAPAVVNGGAIRLGHGEPDIHGDKFDSTYEQYFGRADIDGWQVRKGMNDLLGMDLVPEPSIIIAGLKACRRVNDYALAIRWLEGCKDKCGDHKASIYPWLIQEVQPTLTELGISTPEEMGYGQPELALKSVDDM